MSWSSVEGGPSSAFLLLTRSPCLLQYNRLSSRPKRHGISIALYNTAFGLMVAIPSLIFWRYFRARVDAYLLTLELSAQQLVSHLRLLRKS